MVYNVPIYKLTKDGGNVAEKGTKWTEREDEILRETYPTGGTRETIERLAEEGFDRKNSSVRMRAHVLGVRNDSYSCGNRADAWEDAELDVVRDNYVEHGAKYIQDILREMGHERTLGAIRGHATMLGLHRKNTPSRRFCEKAGATRVLNVVFDDVRDREILEHLSKHENRSEYIRTLIASDMSYAVAK